MSKRAVLFPGQGAQFVGMSARLTERCPEVLPMFEAASELLGRDLLALTTEGPEEVLNSTAISQPAIFVVSLAAVEAIRRAGGGAGLEVEAAAGLSLGEYSALVFAGAMSFEDALRIVVARGAYMQEACDRNPSGMTSLLGCDLETVRSIVEEASSAGTIGIANINAKNQIVVSGDLAALERVAEIAPERGARRVVPLKVAGAYHSPLMASASERLRPALQEVRIVSPRMDFYPNVHGEPISDPDVIRRGLMEQIESSVLWEPTLSAMVARDVTSFLEVGPGRVIAGLVRQVDRTLPVTSLLDQESVEEFVGSIG
ncbi:MAG: ACP S-malonyltransferase [Planctomycetes bacterium]|nr:ACP S-malonyltransferase [Planctomycetota bacterium]